MAKFNDIHLSRILSEIAGPGLCIGGAKGLSDRRVCLVQAAFAVSCDDDMPNRYYAPIGHFDNSPQSDYATPDAALQTIQQQGWA